VGIAQSTKIAQFSLPVEHLYDSFDLSFIHKSGEFILPWAFFSGHGEYQVSLLLLMSVKLTNHFLKIKKN